MKEWKSLEELTEWETRIIEKSIKQTKEIKHLLLCFGIGDTPLARGLAKIVNPSGEKRTGNVGIPLKLGNGSIVNAITSVVYDYTNNDFTAASPLKLEGSINDIGIYFQGQLLDKAELIKPGEWINKKTKSGRPYSSIMLPEAGNFLMSAIPFICSYQEKGSPCLFCDYKNGSEKGVDDFVEVAVAAFKENPCYSLTLTGGNTETEDRGIRRYIPFVKEISKAVQKVIGKKPLIQVEASPPGGNSERYIDELIEAGATSFMMNLEQGNEKYRKIICPEKSKIPLQDYGRAFRYIIEERKLGAASVLINGLLEPLESTIRYAEMLVSMKVRPVILPFRPKGELKKRYPANPIKFYTLSKEVGALIEKNIFDELKTEGCANCPGCALIQKDLGYK